MEGGSLSYADLEADTFASIVAPQILFDSDITDLGRQAIECWGSWLAHSREYTFPQILAFAGELGCYHCQEVLSVFLEVTGFAFEEMAAKLPPRSDHCLSVILSGKMVFWEESR